MTLSFILILLLVAAAALFRRRRMVAGLLGGIGAIVFFSVGCGWLPTRLLTPLQSAYAVSSEPHWEARNAIVLLGMATELVPGSNEVEVNSFAYGRIARTAALYQACKRSQAECRVIVSGGDARGYGKPEAAVYANYLAQLGVAEADLLLEDRSMNTWQNAQFTSALLQARRPAFDRVWLVSSTVHLARSTLYFSHFNVNAVPVRADYLSAPVTLVPAGYNFALMDVALHEYLGIWRKRVYDSLGWNVTASRAGDV